MLSGIFHTHKIPIKSGSSHKKQEREREMRKGEREERGRENEMKRFTSHTGSDSLSCFLSQEKETNEGCLQTSYK